MPRIKALHFILALAAWLALTLPTAAGDPPDDPASTGSAMLLIKTFPAVVHSASPGNATTAALAAQPATAGISTAPHRAIWAAVQPEIALPAPRLTLLRPFTDPHRQSPETTFLYGSTGDGRYVLHTGVDIMNPVGTPVRSVADAQVVFAGDDAQQVFGPRPGFYGNLVVTRLNGTPEEAPIYVLYGHLHKVLVAPGQQVRSGDLVGLVGMTGIAIGPHLHLEVRQGNSSYEATRNPALWLASLPGRGALAARIVDQAGQLVAGERLLIYRAARPSQVWRVVRSYLDSPLIHGDDAAGENLVLPDIPAGDYRIVAGRSGGMVSIPVRIEPGRLTLLEIRVQGGS